MEITFLSVVLFGLIVLLIVTFILNLINGAKEYCEHPHKHKKSYIYFLTISEYGSSLINNKIKGKIMALSLKDTQQAAGTLAFVDKKGNSTDVADGAVTVTSSDESVATVSYDDPTNTITVVAGKPGVAALSIKAKNAAGEDLPFEDVAIEVLSGDATAGSVTFGAPTEHA